MKKVLKLKVVHAYTLSGAEIYWVVQFILYDPSISGISSNGSLLFKGTILECEAYIRLEEGGYL